MSLLLIGLLVLFVVVLVLGVSLCVAAGRSDEALERASRERQQEREARSELYGPGGGWRAP